MCNCESEYSCPLSTIADKEELCRDYLSLMRTAELADDDHKGDSGMDPESIQRFAELLATAEVVASLPGTKNRPRNSAPGVYRRNPLADYASLLTSAPACRRYHKDVRRMCPAGYHQ